MVNMTPSSSTTKVDMSSVKRDAAQKWLAEKQSLCMSDNKTRTRCTGNVAKRLGVVDIGRSAIPKGILKNNSLGQTFAPFLCNFDTFCRVN